MTFRITIFGLLFLRSLMIYKVKKVLLFNDMKKLVELLCLRVGMGAFPIVPSFAWYGVIV